MITPPTAPQTDSEISIFDPTPNLTIPEDQASKFDNADTVTEDSPQKNNPTPRPPQLVTRRTPEQEAKRKATLNANRKSLYIAAIRTHCLECTGSPRLVSLCDADGYCSFWNLRTIPDMRKAKKSRLRTAIKTNCTQCLGTESDICISHKCKTYKFRLGRRLTPP